MNDYEYRIACAKLYGFIQLWRRTDERLQRWDSFDKESGSKLLEQINPDFAHDWRTLHDNPISFSWVTFTMDKKMTVGNPSPNIHNCEFKSRIDQRRLV